MEQGRDGTSPGEGWPTCYGGSTLPKALLSPDGADVDVCSHTHQQLQLGWNSMADASCYIDFVLYAVTASSTAVEPQWQHAVHQQIAVVA